MSLHSFLKPIGYAICKIFWRVEIKNEDIAPKKGSYILVSNHISMLDPVIYVCMLKRKVRFMAKQELFKNKLFAKFFNAMGAFPIQRGTGDLKALEFANEILENGEPMGIFAEGTRSKTGDLLPFKSGAALMAQKAQAPIVTVAVSTKDQKQKLFRKVTITFGKVFTPEELGIADGSIRSIKIATRTIREDIASMLGQSSK